jgi:ABC-type Mn2+/Zn2+ transport system ATPase subunit
MLSCSEIVLMGACSRVGPGKFLGRSEREFARECLKRTGVEDLQHRRFAELSGGQKQRVLIARALIAKPDLLLLDEPTAGVDSAATEAIAELLQRLNRDGLTLVMVNHDMPVVQRVARRVWWANEGAITERSPAETTS